MIYKFSKIDVLLTDQTKKTHLSVGFFMFEIKWLFQFGFFIHDMFAHHWIKFFDL